MITLNFIANLGSSRKKKFPCQEKNTKNCFECVPTMDTDGRNYIFRDSCSLYVTSTGALLQPPINTAHNPAIMWFCPLLHRNEAPKFSLITPLDTNYLDKNPKAHAGFLILYSLHPSEYVRRKVT